MHIAGIPGTFTVFYVFNHTVLQLVQEICYLFSILSTHCSFFIKCGMYSISTLILPSFSHVNMAKPTLICDTMTFYTQIFEIWLLPTNKYVKKGLTTQVFF